MTLLLRLFFIRRSKNNQRRSHAGKPRQPGLPKKQTRELGWSQACAKKDCAPAKLARLSAKNPQGSWAMALLMKTRLHPSPGWHAGERRPFSRQAVNNQGKLRGNGVSRTGACGHARDHRCSFKKIQSLIWALLAACASESGAADPALARAITKSDGCSTAGRKDGNQAVSPTARRQRKHQADARNPAGAPKRFLGPPDGLWAEIYGGGRQVWPARSRRSFEPVAGRRMHERIPWSEVAHRLCANDLWAIGRMVFRKIA